MVPTTPSSFAACSPSPIHDRATRRLTLSRDQFGIKPLYTAAVAGGIAFASEPQALLAAGLVQPVVRPAARAELLQMQFTTGAETIFEGIQRVLPGETLVAVDGHLVERHRQAALPADPPESIDEAAALSRLDAALMESVDLHQRSDVPYGMFLSSGVDSAAVLTLMARPEQPAGAGLHRRVRCARRRRRAGGGGRGGAGGRRAARDRGPSAKPWSGPELPQIVAAMDDPAADYAIIPTWFLARRARQDVKVVLSGEGGDEMFAGYGRYRSAMRPWWRGGRSMRRPRHL